MPRRLKVQTNEMGMLELYLIYDEAGVWEEQWRPLQSSADIVGLSSVSKETMEQALWGWTKPLVESLGPLPKGRLIGLPEESRLCADRIKCRLHDESRCSHLLPKMPWCFVPDLKLDAESARLLMELISYWREGVYTILVREF